MKKPIHGDEVTILYQGTTMKATCGEVTELPDRGAGAAKFTITSRTVFRNGAEASLLDGGSQMPLKVEGVLSLSHRKINIVCLFGHFPVPGFVELVNQPSVSPKG
jgi:hypothetical protein